MSISSDLNKLYIDYTCMILTDIDDGFKLYIAWFLQIGGIPYIYCI